MLMLMTMMGFSLYTFIVEQEGLCLSTRYGTVRIMSPKSLWKLGECLVKVYLRFLMIQLSLITIDLYDALKMEFSKSRPI